MGDSSVHRRWAVTICLLAVQIGWCQAVSVQSGKQYYVNLVKPGYCGASIDQMTFNTDSCASGTAGPFLRDKNVGSTSAKKWIITVQKKNSDGSYQVTIKNYWTPGSPKPRCNGGFISASRLSTCSGPSAQTVTMSTNPGQNANVWTMVPVSGSSTQFQLVLKARAPGCLRYLGASGDCGDPYLNLYKSDDKKGNQRWTITAVSGGDNVAPGRPVIANDATTPTTWSVSWKDGTPGNPPESNTLLCVEKGRSCDAPPLEQQTDIPRGQQSAVLDGLPPDTTMSCYVVAVNSVGSACSSARTVTTPPLPPDNKPPGRPTNTKWTTATNTASATWTDGAAGIPEEFYKLKCVAVGAACDAAAVGAITSVDRGVQAGTVYNLPLQGRLTCYVIADNGVGAPVCSSPTDVLMPGQPPAAPTRLNAVGAINSIAISWADSNPAGVPPEVYNVQCVLAGGACDAAQQGNTAVNIKRGVGKATVTSLPQDTAFDCYVVAVNPVASVCSAAVRVSTASDKRKPSAPLNVRGPVSSTGWTAIWDDSLVAGAPPETYTAFCTAGLGSTCNSIPIGTTQTVSRGVQQAQVFNLTPGTKYTCWVAAQNSVGRTCSSGYTITTIANSQAPGPPTQVGGFLNNNGQFSAFWTDSNPGASPIPETYKVKCVDLYGACTAAQRGTSPSGIPRGVNSGTVNNLIVGNSYSCYVIAQAPGYTDRCSTPYNLVNQNLAPSAPVVYGDFQDVIPGGTILTLYFSDSDQEGKPPQTYTAKCVALGAPYTATAIGNPQTNIPIGVGQATISGLPTRVQVSCYVIATAPNGAYHDVPSAAYNLFISN